MKKLVLLIVSTILIITQIASFAHSGRTDSSGGHRDNKNRSGLGYYHYHHGYGPHLHTNGICPYETSAKVISKTSPSKSFNFTLQQKLNDLGYNCGTPDGIIGNKTKSAIKAFQKDNGLDVDGIVGPKTRAALGI